MKPAAPRTRKLDPRRIALACWLLLVVLTATIAVRTRYVADLSAFLPSTPTAEQAVLLDQLRSGVAARLVLIGIDGGSEQERADASIGLAGALRKSGAFDAVHNGDNSGFEQTARFLFEHRYLLSPAVDAQRFTVDGLRDGILDTTSLLGTPAGALVKPVLLRDPTGETLRMAEGMLPAQSPRSDGRVWISRTKPRAVMIATTHADGSDIDAQESALHLIHEQFAPFAARGLELKVSGAGTFAVSSRAQIKTEVERLAIAGGVAIVGLLLVAFGGSLRTLLLGLLPVASGVLAGIAAVSLAFGNVHGITLGFGTTLIGEAVDYAIYYLIQARTAPGLAASAGARQWIAGNWPTVRLGLLTSVCGFAALLFSGFPGLAQLGLFSVAGLAGAAFTTRYVMTALSPDGAPGSALRSRLGKAVGAATAFVQRLRWPLAALTVAAVIAVAWLPSPWRGTLSSLSPVGAAQLALDSELRGDVGATDPGLLVAVAGRDEASVLAAAEAAGSKLDALVASGAVGSYASPARMLPSPALQLSRQGVLPDAQVLRTRLAEATADGPLPAARLDAFVADVQAARNQPLVTRASLAGTPLNAALDALLVPGVGERPWRALLTLAAGSKPLDVAALRAAVADVPSAQVVDISGELASIYGRYLHEAIWQALIGALAVCALLVLHLRSAPRFWRVAMPVAASVVIVIAALSLAGVALGILHLVGLLLTVAIGSNYALFFDQLRTQADAHVGDAAFEVDNDTLASLALANLTAVISFCLLALSSIPALFSIGEVVAPGIALCLVLSAAFIPVRRR
jgi:predicted exporter